ncbi:hypothetical protein Nepgr_008819 [Nepenthes gracilis]|uniref:Protein kinase domain-containing protein n=1 Tax=Nepenthes gracilis TaxID=150966 RepID=A0AAD3S9T3_NEPGR|nr:hypothetical protein Nepgr_008819 [Nepenthes gracilis]
MNPSTMAERRATNSMGCVFFFITIMSIPFLLSNGDELASLLTFKASMENDPLDYLSNWNKSTSPCTWNGITCAVTHHVTGINVSGKNISGGLSGSIFGLPYIEVIDLSSNQLSGRIPFDAFSCSSLRHLNLSNNNLTGQIFMNETVRGLETLDLSNNMLAGKIPENIGEFSILKYLDLGGNVLVGKIPISVSNLTGLEYLTLASNQLFGEIPRELDQMKSLKWIYLGYNKFSGKIPKEFGHLPSLNHLDLVYNNLTGQIPSSLGNLTDLQFLFLYQNRLTGPIPKSIFSLRKLISLDLSDNFLSGEIPELIVQLQRLEVLHLFSNNFTGKIPNAISSLRHLQVLQLWSNNLTGEIPHGLGKSNNLTVLDLSTNSLTGKIPGSLCNSGQLFKLILFSNSLQGEIPFNLSQCHSLRRVRLQNNRLSGELPERFTTLPLVYYLELSGNNLSGDIGRNKWSMPFLEMMNLAKNKFSGNLPDLSTSSKLENLDLSVNQFSGNIPSRYGKLRELMQLKLGSNSISGRIPSELSSCKKLVRLDLSRNQLSGPIPPSLGSLPVLGQLDLSENQLSGEIPTNLGTVDSLVQVNVSHNHLYGSLPSTGAFLAINWSAVAGNNLCGNDPASGLPPCKGGKSPFWWSFTTCILGMLGLTAAAACLSFFMQRRNKLLKLKKEENEDGIWELQFFDSKASREITIHDIISSRKEENLISKRKQGVSYKGRASSLKAMQFVVEEINHSSPASENLWTEVSKLGRVRHPNILSILGLCKSKKVALLVNEYAEGKNLSEVLRVLSWERRRRVHIGLAKALRFLHCRCSPSVLIGEVSPENVIVAGEDKARLRLGVPGLFCMEHSWLVSSAYVAPETRENKEMVTDKSDVYGFGLILIEMLTGKSAAAAADEEFGANESIVGWARYCYSDCHLDAWVDPTIIRGKRLSDENQMVQTMNLALRCTADDPTARPSSSDIVKTLDSISRKTNCIFGLQLSSVNY